MKKICMLILVVLMMATTVQAAEVSIGSDKGIGKIMSTKIDDETVRIDVTVRLYNGKEPMKNEYVTIAMYGPTEPKRPCYEKDVNGKVYYSYFVDQVRTDNDGEVDFSFYVEVSSEETCYLFFSGKNVEVPFELSAVLPPVESQNVKPMDKPSLSGGGGGGGKGSASAGAFPEYSMEPYDPAKNIKNDMVFIDMTENHWAYNDCVKLYQRGIITGDGDGRIRPSDYISRQEIAAVLLKAFQIDIPETDIVLDDTSSLWAKNYLAAAVKNGIMMEDVNGTYRGNSSATRAEVVTMVNRCLKLGGNAESLKAFSDCSEIPEYSAEAFSALVENGIVNGYEDNTVRPNQFIARAELFKIISKIFEEGLA